MNGWTEAGNRPEFKLVTGVSTGALIAPFAFLGPAYDEQLTISRPGATVSTSTWRTSLRASTPRVARSSIPSSCKHSSKRATTWRPRAIHGRRSRRASDARAMSPDGLSQRRQEPRSVGRSPSRRISLSSIETASRARCSLSSELEVW
ncbi:hypothetical protein [Thiocapsa sp.]|uniref:hypothetical protein n=1 Tax=Thiocapsa sp. TaxID=2024551 RepID=UPI00260D74F7|nr:hypothetical protein [Thiocapsa sp.]